MLSQIRDGYSLTTVKVAYVTPAWLVCVQLVSPLMTSQLDNVVPVRHSSRRPSKPIYKWLLTEAVAAKRERRRLDRRWLSTSDIVIV